MECRKDFFKKTFWFFDMGRDHQWYGRYLYLHQIVWRITKRVFYWIFFCNLFREFIISSEEFATVSWALAFFEVLFQPKATLQLGLIIVGVDRLHFTKKERGIEKFMTPTWWLKNTVLLMEEGDVSTVIQWRGNCHLSLRISVQC